MAVRPNKLDTRSSMFTQSAVFWQGVLPAAMIDVYINNQAMPASPSPTATITGSSFYCAVPTNLVVAFQTATAGDSCTIKIDGENQFGDTVTEDITVTQGANTFTTWCYRRVTAMTYTAELAGTVNASDTLDVGWTPNSTSCRIPVHSKATVAGMIKAAGLVGATTSATPTVTTGFTYNATRFNISVPVALATPYGYIIHLDPAHKAYA